MMHMAYRAFADRFIVLSIYNTEYVLEINIIKYTLSFKFESVMPCYFIVMPVLTPYTALALTSR